jgi:hypothetical protein
MKSFPISLFKVDSYVRSVAEVKFLGLVHAYG